MIIPTKFYMVIATDQHNRQIVMEGPAFMDLQDVHTLLDELLTCEWCQEVCILCIEEDIPREDVTTAEVFFYLEERRKAGQHWSTFNNARFGHCSSARTTAEVFAAVADREAAELEDV